MKRYLSAKTDIVVDRNEDASNIKISVTCTCKRKITRKIVIKVIDRNMKVDLQQ